VSNSESAWIVSRILAPDGAYAVSFLVAEGAETLLGFDALEWWNSLAADDTAAPRALFGARDSESGEWLGVVACQTHPGRVAYVWQPVVKKSVAAANPRLAGEIAFGLLDALGEWLREKGTQVAQCVLEQSAAHGDVVTASGRDELFLRAGYRHEVRLEFLELDLAERNGAGEVASSVPPAFQPCIEWIPFDESRRELFASTAERTLIASADCRFLSGLRTGADLLAAHAGTEGVDAELWFVAVIDGSPVGVLLLRSDGPQNLSGSLSSGGEISYLGVVPERRGAGWGRRLVEQAATMARLRGWAVLGAALDSTNHYAKTVYESSGFVVRGAMRGRVRVF
jgi:ribosomal protein S18 acetylase RimI-like enzyme